MGDLKPGDVVWVRGVVRKVRGPYAIVDVPNDDGGLDPTFPAPTDIRPDAQLSDLERAVVEAARELIAIGWPPTHTTHGNLFDAVAALTASQKDPAP